jgi:spore coat polysaccharide biosynthesis protein SpsF (cytidylyltransferase family)
LNATIVLKSKLIGGLVIVIPDTQSNDNLFEHLTSKGSQVFRGSSENVLQRFFDASKIHKSELIIRLTADCPLIMPTLIDDMLEFFDEVKPEYLSNKIPPTFPDGLDVEIFETKILKNLMQYNLTESEKEHVTLGIYRRPDEFKTFNYTNSEDISYYRWTVDYLEDFNFVTRVYNYFWDKKFTFTINDVIAFINLNPLENDNKIGAEYRDISLKEF